jgi:TolA-binding protein
MNGIARYFTIILLLLGLVSAGCWKKAAPAAPEPPAANRGEYITAPAAITPSEPPVVTEQAEYPQVEATASRELFLEAERNFAGGNYRRAAQAFERFLNTFPKTADRDQALFHLAFSLALSGDDRDLLQTEAALRRLISEFPKSPYRRQAEWILELNTRSVRLQSDVKARDERIRQLSDELRKLKAIDLDRRPSRPE